jgi:nucleotide-binding universal stress UspA family protein
MVFLIQNSMQTSFKDILVPTDFSGLAANAMITAIEMCKRHDAVLHLMHVVENRPSTASTETEKNSRDELSALAKKIFIRHSIRIQQYLEFGNPAKVIGDKAIELNCKLIVMGTHGSSGFRELFIGNTAYSVIKNTTIPVLTIPGKKQVINFDKILFPIWASRGIMDKYDFIKPVIEKNNAELVILGLSLSSELFDIKDRKKELLQLGESLGMNETRFRSVFHVCKNYAKKVLETAKKEKADLIVINASLDHTWRKFFVGPYARQIVNHSKIPVLSIREPAPAPEINQPVKRGRTLVEA